MNVVDGLERVRRMLEDNGAAPATLQAVDAVLANADRISGGSNAQAQSLLRLTRMLMRTPASQQDVRVYNDLARLEEQLAERAESAQREREALDSRPMPKDHKFYKAQKAREKATKKGE